MNYRVWACGAAVAALLLIPQAGDSCGPFLETMEFTTYHGFLPSDFETGHLGVVRPHFWREDLLLAYRAFSGIPLTSQDDATHPPGAFGQREEPWLKARREIAGAPDIQHLETDRKVPGADYQEYPNCLEGAFASAIETLHDRAGRWGAQSAELAEWLRGQDQVFRNCSTGAAVPPPVSAPADLAADRQYQIAAAEFYSEQYGKAEADFDRIAGDQQSPWHEIAPYLAARACIRHATIGGAPGKLKEASQRLAAITQGSYRQAAQSLIGFVQARLEPQQRLVELGQQLLQPDLGARLGRVLTDYTKIWDQLEEDKQQPPIGQSDLAAWIAAFQHGIPPGTQPKDTLPWLVASLVWAPAADPSNASLIRAAHAVAPDSPAYASVSYYGILRQIRTGETDAARQWADDALSKTQSPAAVNMLRAERLRLARGWTEFIRFSTRNPVAAREFDDTDSPLPTTPGQKNTISFDRDATDSLNLATPLRRWIEAAGDRSLPAGLRERVAQAGWVRAILLNDPAAAKTLARSIAASTPELAGEMAKYLAEADPAAARFAAVFLMLRAPGFQPTIRAGFPRETPIVNRDLLRDNWWAIGAPLGRSDDLSSGNHEALYDLYRGVEFIPPDFLGKDERAAGEEEWRKLKESAGNGVNYLCAAAIDWAKAHPKDARVPQALHEAVEATHYGPADRTSSTFSKQAFDLLHRSYPDSVWTKQTKYWY